MIKVKIVMDEERIIKDKKYSLDAMWTLIAHIFDEQGIKQTSKGEFSGNGTDKDFALLSIANIRLSYQEWFVEYVKEWWWMNSDYGKNEDDFVVSDVIKGMHIFDKR